jgi:hypothetical protein
MERIIEKVLDPAVVWVLVPIFAILVWGLNRMLLSLRGVPQDAEELKIELRQLRARVDELEQAQQRLRQPGGEARVAAPGRPG